MVKTTAILILFLLQLTICRGQTNIKSKSDTTAVIEFAVRAAMNGYLPDRSFLMEKFYFIDSILFTAREISIDLLPSLVDSFRFKVLSQAEVCRTIKNDSALGTRPNYLYLGSFTKRQHVYHIQLASVSCFEGHGGGMVYFEFVKQNDSFVLQKKAEYSIN